MSLDARLRRLEAAGAAAFDGPGFRFVKGLLDRATALGGHAAERLATRAETRLTVFESSFLAAKAEAGSTLETLEAAGADPDGRLRAVFERGDYKALRREAVRALRRARDTTQDDATRRVERLTRQCRAQGLTLSPALRAATQAARSTAESRVVGDRLARALFHDAAQHARSALSVARAADALPEQVGMYNPQALVIEALGLMESISPAYLRAVLSGLEDLAYLKALPEPPTGKKRRRRR